MKVKFESVPPKATDEASQDSLIRHLQSRISDLRDDNTRLRDSQQSKSILSSFHEVKKTLRIFNHSNYFSFRMILKMHSLPCVQGIIQQRNKTKI